MKIHKQVIKNISSAVMGNDSEIGGILGSSENGIITDMILDRASNTSCHRFEYRPDTIYLNDQIMNWSERGIDFYGIFHTHFSGSKNLSDADSEYIREIMRCAEGIVEHLYFPIYTLPDNELTVYKAYFDKEEIKIVKDDLTVV